MASTNLGGIKMLQLKPYPPNLQDHKFKATQLAKAEQLLEAVDLRSGCSPVVEQGEIGSCTTQSGSSGLGLTI
jgi:hypothetical protein